MTAVWAAAIPAVVARIAAASAPFTTDFIIGSPLEPHVLRSQRQAVRWVPAWTAGYRRAAQNTALRRSGGQQTPASLPGLAWSARQACGISPSVPHRAVPIVHFATDLIGAVTVAVLDLAFEIFSPPLDRVEVLVRQLRPFLLDLALDLLPVALDAVPVGRRLQGADGGFHGIGRGARYALTQFPGLVGPSVHLGLRKFRLELNELLGTARPQHALGEIERVRDGPRG